MEEIQLGTKIRILPRGADRYTSEGDIARIIYPIIFRKDDPSDLTDMNGHYWADFNDCGNSYVYRGGIECVGVPDLHFEILEENV